MGIAGGNGFATKCSLLQLNAICRYQYLNLDAKEPHQTWVANISILQPETLAYVVQLIFLNVLLFS